MELIEEASDSKDHFSRFRFSDASGQAGVPMIQWTSFDRNFRQDSFDDDCGFVRDAGVEPLVLQESRQLPEEDLVLL